MGNDGRGGGPVITNAEAGYDWSTYPERLQRAGISWKVYQDSGSALTPRGCGAGPTAIRAQNRDPDGLLRDFREDVRHGRLPQVSWIVAPEAYCEHPNWEPDFGAWYVYHPAGPYGLGIRVPMIIVSPWTRGGWVDSQLFDHTSLIRFLETRFAHGNADLIESNITPWRRAVVGDLTSAFNFAKPNTAWRVRLPDTGDFKPQELVRHPDQLPVPPADPEVPGQERGVRPARHPVHPARRRAGRCLVVQHRLRELRRCGRGLPGAIGRQHAGPAQLHRRVGQAAH